MKIERSKNALNGIVWGTINNGVALILPFIIRTLVIYIFGVEYAGLSGLFTSILQVLNLAELGMSSAIVYSMYKPIANDDFGTLSALLCFYRKVYRIIGLTILIAGICLLPFLDYLIKGSYPDELNIRLLFLIYLANTVTSYLFFAYKTTLLTAHQRTDIISKITIFVRFLQNITQLAIIIFLTDFYLYVGVTVLFTTLNNFLCHRQTVKLYPKIVCEGKLSDFHKCEIKQSVKGLVITQLCMVSRNSFDTIFISSFVGLVATTIYGNYYYLLTTVGGMLSVVLTSIVAGVGNSIETESVEKNHRDMNKLMFIYMWISGWCTCCFVCLYQPFMELWMGKELLLPFGCVVLMSLYFFILRLGDIRAQYSNANGLWWQGRKICITETIVNFVLNFVLGYFFHIWGILIATIISVLFVNFTGLATVLYKEYFKQFSVMSFFSKALLYMLTTIIASTISYVIATTISHNSLTGLIYGLVICLLVPNIIFYLVYMHTDVYADSRNFISELLKSIKQST